MIEVRRETSVICIYANGTSGSDDSGTDGTSGIDLTLRVNRHFDEVTIEGTGQNVNFRTGSITKVFVESCGGKGDNGSRGFDGRNGYDGSSGSSADFYSFNGGEYYTSSAISGGDGENGGPGGDGGAGGRGGGGGCVIITVNERNLVDLFEISVRGGKGGLGGLGGRGGQGGCGGAGGYPNGFRGANGIWGCDGLPGSDGVNGRNGSYKIIVDGEVAITSASHERDSTPTFTTTAPRFIPPRQTKPVKTFSFHPSLGRQPVRISSFPSSSRTQGIRENTALLPKNEGWCDKTRRSKALKICGKCCHYGSGPVLLTTGTVVLVGAPVLYAGLGVFCLIWGIVACWRSTKFPPPCNT